MKIVVAIDSYKGSASSSELNEAVKTGILSVAPDCEVKTFAIADGGEGTIAALENGLDGKRIAVATVDLLECPITAEYLMLPENIAVIEATSVVGIDKIIPNAQTIQEATTRGLAELFLDAQKRGAREIVLSLGGTGTSDGGLGILKGLGGSVEKLPLLKNINLTALADVTNVYAGENGYAKVFGKQKGGTDEILAQQDKEAQKIAQFVKEKYKIDLQNIPGTGAAGGLGAAIVLLGGKIEPGFSKIAQLLNIEDEIKKANLVITGEGHMDFQTANGKVPFGMAELATKYNVPTIAFCGGLGEELGKMNDVLLASFSIQQSVLSLKEAMEKQRTLNNIEKLAKNVIKTWQH
ncbi:glycerate kinase [Lactococcus nasutitermitis]|uniref:Glycerate kinase n=1 Tax=Lactococcus nasutitermitis TaxID=1652957 RepID=A0ABV9JDN9_9LACT|nr:glycerate kinase [Lactococcus nasutitermitis]